MLLYFYCRFYVCLRSTLGMVVPILVGICAPFAFIGLGLLMFYVLHRKKDTSKGKTSFLIAIIIWANLTKNNLQWYNDQKVSFNIKTLFEIRIFRDFCKIARYKYKFVLFVCLFVFSCSPVWTQHPITNKRRYYLQWLQYLHGYAIHIIFSVFVINRIIIIISITSLCRTNLFTQTWERKT